LEISPEWNENESTEQLCHNRIRKCPGGLQAEEGQSQQEIRWLPMEELTDS
jgi:hypothetical protein